MLRSIHPVLLCFTTSLVPIASCLASDDRHEEGAALQREAFVAKLNSVSMGDRRDKVLTLLGEPLRIVRQDGFLYSEALCFGKSKETGDFPVLGTVYIDADGTVSSVVGKTSKLTRHSDQELARIYQDIAVFADLDEGTRHGGVPSAGDLEKSMDKLKKRSTKELLDSLREYARVVPWGMRYDDQNVGAHLVLRAVLDPPAGEYFLLLANRDMFYPQTAEDRANPRFPIKLVDGKPTVIIRPAPFPGVKQVPSIKMDYFLPWYERCQVRK